MIEKCSGCGKVIDIEDEVLICDFCNEPFAFCCIEGYEDYMICDLCFEEVEGL